MSPFPRRQPPDDLTAFHAARGALYQALFELLRRPPDSHSFGAAQEALDPWLAGRAQPRGMKEVGEALTSSRPAEVSDQFGHLFLGPAPRVTPVCGKPGCTIRVQAYRTAEALETPERVSEILVLGSLASRTTEALAAGQLPEASGLTDVQGRFLSHHAGDCLTTMSRELSGGGAPFYERVGYALGSLVADDLRLLGYPDAAR